MRALPAPHPSPTIWPPLLLQTRAYRSLWSGLFKQQAPAVPASRDATGSPAAAAPSDALLRALADAHAWLHPGANASGGGPPSLMHPGGLEDWVGHYLGDLSSLLPGLLPERGGGGEPSLLQRLHDLPADALNRTGLDAGLQQQVATLAAVQAWALVTLLAHGASGTGGAGGGDGGGGSALPSPGGLTAGSFSSSLDMNLVQGAFVWD